MSNFLLQYLLQMAVKLILQYGIPALEQKYPSLVPIFQELLELLKNGIQQPSAHLASASDHYNASLNRV